MCRILEASGERPELARRIAGGDHHLRSVDAAAFGMQSHAARPLLNAAHARSLEDRRAVAIGGIDQAKAGAIGIQLRVAAGANRAGSGEAGQIAHAPRRQPFARQPRIVPLASSRCSNRARSALFV